MVTITGDSRHEPTGYDCPFCTIAAGGATRWSGPDERRPYADRLRAALIDTEGRP